MDDQASTAPGPQGWLGAPIDRRIFDVVSSETPQLFERRPAKAINENALAKLKALQAADGIEGGISLRHIEQYVFGSQLQWLAQIVGSCVGSSFMRLATIRTLWESFILGDPEEIWGTKHVGTNNVAPYAPYGYRAGRKIANINSGDGSYCAAQIAGAQRYGILPCSAQGIVSDAFPEPQSASTYRQQGNSDQFLEKFAPQAGKHKLLESEKVTDADQARTLVTEHFKPLQICSMWAFKPAGNIPGWSLSDGQQVVAYQRDRGTSWAHAMSIVAIVSVAGKWYAIVMNSWGMRAHRNGDWFAISLELLDTWLRDAECMSIGDIELTDNVL